MNGPTPSCRSRRNVSCSRSRGRRFITRRRAKARYLDNIFIERLWRSLKYECVYLHAWETGSQAKAGVGRWITFYNHQRPHAAHGGQGTSPAVRSCPSHCAACLSQSRTSARLCRGLAPKGSDAGRCRILRLGWITAQRVYPFVNFSLRNGL